MKSPAELAAEQAAYWNGPGGQGWFAAYARIERSLAEWGQITLQAADARTGEHVVDVGCGNGGTTTALAHAVGPTGHVLGVDISAPLIEASTTPPSCWAMPPRIPSRPATTISSFRALA